MPIVQVRPFTANLGAAKATGELLVADPREESFVRGTLNILGLEDVSFEARVDTPFQVTGAERDDRYPVRHPSAGIRGLLTESSMWREITAIRGSRRIRFLNRI